MTIKKKRTVVSTLLAAFATMAMSATAFAANDLAFNFDLVSGGDDYTTAAKKYSSARYASVNVEDGNFVNSDRLYLRVCRDEQASDGVYYFATETKWVNSAPYSFTLNYYTGEGETLKKYRLRGYQDGPLSVRANGTWQP